MTYFRQPHANSTQVGVSTVMIVQRRTVTAQQVQSSSSCTLQHVVACRSLQSPVDPTSIANTRLPLRRLRQYSLRIILVVALILGVSLFSLRTEYQWNRGVVAKLGPTHHFAHADEPVFSSLGPHVIGYFEWAGPRFLEPPMRKLNIPWFDRVTRVHLLDDSSADNDSLSALSELLHLRQLKVSNASIPQDVYIECVNRETTSVVFD